MGRKRTIFPIAFACSLGLHAVGMDLYIRYGSFLIQPITRTSRPRAPELVLKVDPQMLDFGEATGRAIGSNRSPGDQPLLAREADEDQALLSREPEGAGKLATPSADIAAPQGGGKIAILASPAMPAPTPAKPLEPRSPALPPSPVSAIKDPAPREPSPQAQVQVSSAEEIQPAPQVLETPVPKPTPTPPAPQQVQIAAVAPSPDPRPGAPVAPGRPIPQTDSDSDPFSRIGGKVVFRNGRLDVQMGRKVKTVRPQIGIAGELDALGMSAIDLVVEVHIDRTGHVTQVELVKKSGSVAIDEPTRNSLYLWEFEPAHDKAGHPIPDVVYFTYGFR